MMRAPILLFLAILTLVPGMTKAQEASSVAITRLEAMETEFIRGFRKAAGLDPDTKLKALQDQYGVALQRAASEAAKTGNLELAVALREEGRWLTENAGAVPRQPEGTELPPLAKLRGIYTAQLTELKKARVTQLASALPAFDTRLATYQSDLTRSGDLDGALAVKAYREAMGEKLRTQLFEAAPTPAAAPVDTLGLIEPVVVDKREWIVEGESIISDIRVSGGYLLRQDYANWSGRAQVFWTQGTTGDTLKFTVRVKEDGNYSLHFHLVHARDYARVRVTPGTAAPKEFNLSEPGMNANIHSFRNVRLTAKDHLTVAVELLDRGGGVNFGLDCLKMTKS